MWTSQSYLEFTPQKTRSFTRARRCGHSLNCRRWNDPRVRGPFGGALRGRRTGTPPRGADGPGFSGRGSGRSPLRAVAGWLCACRLARSLDVGQQCRLASRSPPCLARRPRPSSRCFISLSLVFNFGSSVCEPRQLCIKYLITSCQGRCRHLLIDFMLMACFIIKQNYEAV